MSYREWYLAMPLQTRFSGTTLQLVTLRLVAMSLERDLRQRQRGERNTEELQVVCV